MFVIVVARNESDMGSVASRLFDTRELAHQELRTSGWLPMFPKGLKSSPWQKGEKRAWVEKVFLELLD
ncbi:MAG: hypothetical protein FJZ43_03085 [Candidatus Staskawiczbacteria bacterium]|nr:hypothetical protein [Candidatus Staskawiczbacteria bacterium]